jgi:hypothetical protein
MRILPDGHNAYVILDVNGNVMGWVVKGKDRWRACTARGHLTHHHSRAGAIDAICCSQSH